MESRGFARQTVERRAEQKNRLLANNSRILHGLAHIAGSFGRQAIRLDARRRVGIETEKRKRLMQRALYFSLSFPFTGAGGGRGSYSNDRISWQIFQARKKTRTVAVVPYPRRYSSRYPQQNVGVDITGVQVPILKQQCDQFFPLGYVNQCAAEYRVRRETTDVMSDRQAVDT